MYAEYTCVTSLDSFNIVLYYRKHAVFSAWYWWLQLYDFMIICFDKVRRILIVIYVFITIHIILYDFLINFCIVSRLQLSNKNFHETLLMKHCFSNDGVYCISFTIFGRFSPYCVCRNYVLHKIGSKNNCNSVVCVLIFCFCHILFNITF